MPHLFSRKRYLAGVSGGPDSMALLKLYRPYIRLVCIVNYHLREPQCTNEVKMVQEWCRSHQVQVEVCEVFPPPPSGTNFQHWARTVRYNFFATMAKKYHLTTVLLGHQLDDFLETALKQSREQSLNPFWGIPERGEWNAEDGTVLKIYRPLLHQFRKRDLTQLCRDQHIPFSIDQSNLEGKYERGRLRKEIANWTDRQFWEFYRQVQKRNRRLQAFRHQVDQANRQWQGTNWALTFFQQAHPEIQIQLLYHFLRTVGQEFNCSKTKLTQLQTFLNHQHRDTTLPNKGYRLEKGKFLQIIAGCLVFQTDGGEH